MVDLEAIRSLVWLSGYRKRYIAQQLHMSPYTLNSRLSGKTKFKLDEAMALSSFLHMTVSEREKYFFSDGKGGRAFDQ